MKDSNDGEKFAQLCDLAVACLKQHDITGALMLLLEAQKLEGDRIKVYSLLASCYLVLGEYKQAVECWQEILSIDPANKSAHTHLEMHYRPSHQFWIKRYQEAVEEAEKKNYQAASGMLRSLLAEQDGHVALYQLLGLCYLACDQREEAIKMWQKGLELDQSNPILREYMKLLPGVKKSKLVPENAVDDRKSLISRTRLVWAVSGIILVFLAVPTVFLLNQTADSNSAPHPPVTIRGDQGLAVVNLEDETEWSDRKNGSGQEASPAGSDYDVQKEEQYYFAGRKAYLARDWKNAVDNYNMVVDMGTGSYLNREALYYLARTNYLRGEMGQAEQYYIKYLKEFPGTAYYDDTLFYLGCVYSQQNQKERAVEVFQQLKNIAPDSGYLSSNIYKKVME